QLNQIIFGASGLEPWRAAVVKHPEIIDYCGLQEFRWEHGSEEIYLLKKQQMNGAHAEMFSYALYQELVSDISRKSLEPLKVDSYQSVTMTEFEPCVWLSFSCEQRCVNFSLWSSNKCFQIQVKRAELENLPQV